MSNVAINIAAEFKGKPAFDKAAKSTASLEKSVGRLARTMKRTFATTAIIAFGRASVRAFVEDEKAASRLSTAVQNLGYRFSQLEVSNFIQELEASSGIMDDQLRPAFQSLLTTTGSLTMSQKLLNDAIQISRASGEDLTTVASDLSMAYVGNVKGIRKYYTGLTQAELATKGFSEILSVLLKNSAGAAENYLGTTAYKMGVLSVATENAKESIGAGLIDAFAKMAGGTEVEDAVKAINSIANAINGITSAIGTVIGFFTKMYQAIDKFAKNIDPIFGDSWNQTYNKPRSARSASPAGTYRRMQEQKKAELEAIARNKKLAALEREKAAAAAKALQAKKDAAALEKLSLLLKEGEGIFDKEGVELAAAQAAQAEQLAKATNQGQLLAIANDMTRISIKRNMLALEQAIQDGDVKAAEAAASRLNTDLKQLTVLSGQQLKLVDIKKILETMVSKDLINIANLNLALEKIKEMQRLLNPTGFSNLSKDDSGFISATNQATIDEMVYAAESNADLLLAIAAANEALVTKISEGSALAAANKIIIDLKLSGDGEVTDSIVKNIQNKSLTAGQIAYLDRRTGGFG